MAAVVSVNAQMSKWADERYRTLCDAYEIFLAKLLAWQADYAAQGIGALASTDANNNIGNGVPADGRPLVTGLNVTNFNTAVNQVVTAMNVTLVAGVGTTAKAQADIGQVNGSAR
jgi:hypothetical protein